MNVTVWDTYVTRADGRIMHFDIMAPSEITNEELIASFGRHYLRTKSFAVKDFSSKSCRLCHVEPASEEMLAAIQQEGYAIVEMENCD